MLMKAYEEEWRLLEQQSIDFCVFLHKMSNIECEVWPDLPESTLTFVPGGPTSPPVPGIPVSPWFGEPTHTQSQIQHYHSIYLSD